jgi:electron transport complex protein RnfG
MNLKLILQPGIALFVFTAVSVFFVSCTQVQTKVSIQYNEKQVLTKRLNELVSEYDNDILAEKYSQTITLHGLEQVVNIYPAKRNHQTFALLIEHIYPKGYSGNIHLLTGVNRQGELLGVRVVKHQETPGLGDKIELKKSDWILQFKGLAIGSPMPGDWKVTKDGGVFDAFTGATVTPRAIVSASYELLTYFNQHCSFSKDWEKDLCN